MYFVSLGAGCTLRVVFFNGSDASSDVDSIIYIRDDVQAQLKSRFHFTLLSLIDCTKQNCRLSLQRVRVCVCVGAYPAHPVAETKLRLSRLN